MLPESIVTYLELLNASEKTRQALTSFYQLKSQTASFNSDVLNIQACFNFLSNQQIFCPEESVLSLLNKLFENKITYSFLEELHNKKLLTNAVLKFLLPDPDRAYQVLTRRLTHFCEKQNQTNIDRFLACLQRDSVPNIFGADGFLVYADNNLSREIDQNLIYEIYFKILEHQVFLVHAECARLQRNAHTFLNVLLRKPNLIDLVKNKENLLDRLFAFDKFFAFANVAFDSAQSIDYEINFAKPLSEEDKAVLNDVLGSNEQRYQGYKNISGKTHSVFFVLRNQIPYFVKLSHTLYNDKEELLLREREYFGKGAEGSVKPILKTLSLDYTPIETDKPAILKKSRIRGYGPDAEKKRKARDKEVELFQKFYANQRQSRFFTIDHKVYCLLPKMGNATLSVAYLRSLKFKDLLPKFKFMLNQVHDFQQKTNHVHGDIKIENFSVDAGQINLVDFGLCQEMGSARKSLGSPLYLAPEIHGSGSAEYKYQGSLDVYGLGLVFFMALYEFVPKKHVETLPLWVQAQIRNYPQENPYMEGPDFLKIPGYDITHRLVYEKFQAVLDKMLEKDYAQRYETCLEVIEDICEVENALLNFDSSISYCFYL